MLAKRIIACLDVRDGRVVKGQQFKDHQDLGSILELASRYSDEGIDELVFYDITASSEGRSVDTRWIEQVAQKLNIPFCVAGGIRTVARAQQILASGADKVSVNSPALETPQLINDLVAAFGSQCVVVGIDTKTVAGQHRVYRYTGKVETTQAESQRDLLSWVQEVQVRGAGEIVLNSMNQDGMKAGYDIEVLRKVRDICHVPLVASGGAGQVEHFREVFEQAQVDAALAAGVFHRREILVQNLKVYLKTNAIAIRGGV